TFGAAGTDLWLSVVMKGLGTNASSSDGIITLRNAASSSVNISTGTNTSANFSIKDATGGISASSSVPNSTLSLLVVHYQFLSGADIVDLYANPIPGGAPPGSSSAQLTSLDTGTGLDRIAVTGATFGATPIQIDEIRLGSTFASVTPVPEPSALLLAG